MKIAFFGTSEFGIPTLKALHENFGVEFVVTGTAKPAHRGKRVVNTPIFEEAKLLGIERVYTPEKLTKEFEDYLSDMDYVVVVSYGKILPERILRSVNHGNSEGRFLNIHPSSLPLFRGAAPIERTIEAGHTKTHVCVINMEKELDAGNILAKEECEILPEENSISLHERFSEVGASLVVDLIKNGANMNEKQDDNRATYAKKIEKSELELYDAKNITCGEVLNKIRAFTSYGYCFTFYNGRRVKIISAEISGERKSPLDISCFDGFVSPKIIRPEGRANISIEEFISSY